MENCILKIDHVSKEYKLGEIGGTTLRDELQRTFAKLRKKEDPTKKIGAKEYNKGEKFLALNGVSFEVGKGERVGIIGHNGAGKSTLLKLISRITAPTDGTISLNGRITSMLEVGTGFHPELTGRENIYMNGAILGMTKKEIDAKMEDIIEFSEVRQFIDTPVKRYSSGMYVKLAFSVAAHLDSEIMIMDEVLAVGDIKFQEKCLNKMSDVSMKQGRTILYVSHNMNTIRQLCDRVVVLDRGKVVFDGDVEKAIEVYSGCNNLSDRAIDLSGFQRSAMFADDSVTFTELVIDTNSSSFESGQTMRGTLKVISKLDVSNVRLECVIKSNTGVPVTRFLSKPSMTLSSSDQNNVIHFEMDISLIAPGIYTLSPIIREINSFGSEKHLDGIMDAYRFEIVPSKELNNGANWNPKWSGYYMSPEMEVSCN